MSEVDWGQLGQRLNTLKQRADAGEPAARVQFRRQATGLVRYFVAHACGADRPVPEIEDRAAELVCRAGSNGLDALDTFDPGGGEAFIDHVRGCLALLGLRLPVAQDDEMPADRAAPPGGVRQAGYTPAEKRVVRAHKARMADIPGAEKEYRAAVFEVLAAINRRFPAGAGGGYAAEDWRDARLSYAYERADAHPDGDPSVLDRYVEADGSPVAYFRSQLQDVFRVASATEWEHGRAGREQRRRLEQMGVAHREATGEALEDDELMVMLTGSVPVELSAMDPAVIEETVVVPSAPWDEVEAELPAARQAALADAVHRILEVALGEWEQAVRDSLSASGHPVWLTIFEQRLRPVWLLLAQEPVSAAVFTAAHADNLRGRNLYLEEHELLAHLRQAGLIRFVEPPS